MKAVRFLNSVRKHLVILITSGTIIAALGIWQGTGHHVWPWVYWAVVIGGFGWACYQTWQEQEDRIAKLELVVQQHEDKRLNIRKALYSQLSYHYAYIRHFTTQQYQTHQEQDLSAELIAGIDKSAHKWAQTQADVFYQLPEALDIDSMYVFIERVRTSCLEPMKGQAGIGYGQCFVERVEKLVLSGKMDNELFRQIAPRVYETITQKKLPAGT
jgi:L-cysteine desulfidase